MQSTWQSIKILFICLAVACWIIVLYMLLGLVGIVASLIHLCLPFLSVLKFSTFTLTPCSCCHAFIMRKCSLLLSRLYIVLIIFIFHSNPYVLGLWFCLLNFFVFYQFCQYLSFSAMQPTWQSINHPLHLSGCGVCFIVLYMSSGLVDIVCRPYTSLSSFLDCSEV